MVLARADIDAVLFDMDGTLVDSDAAVERTWRRWAGDHGVVDRLAGVDLHGRPGADTIRELRPDLDEVGVAAAARESLALEYADVDGIVACPGASEAIAALEAAGLPWAVVTSADHRLAGIRLSAAGLTAPVLVTTDDVVRGKPDPEGYLLAARRLRVPIDRCLVVEDSVVGLAAGRAAGAPTAALRGLTGDLELTDLHELAAFVSGSRS